MTDRMYHQSLVVLLLSGLVLIWIGRYTDLDLWLSDWMYDHARRDFPWRERWFAAVFMHNWVKGFFIGVAIALAVALAADMALHMGWFSSPMRRKLAAVIGASVVVPLTVVLMKSRSIHHCPWDLQRYGGFAPYLRVFDHLPEGVKAGHCFPAGHASSGLWLGAFAIFWLPERPSVARAVFGVALIPGLMLGWTQQLRGAHFLTHTLWSVWIATLVIVLISRYVNRLQ